MTYDRDEYSYLGPARSRLRRRPVARFQERIATVWTCG